MPCAKRFRAETHTAGMGSTETSAPAIVRLHRATQVPRSLAGPMGSARLSRVWNGKGAASGSPREEGYRYWLNSTRSWLGPSRMKYFTPLSQKGRYSTPWLTTV